MQIIVKILEQESETVKSLFYTYQAETNILQQLMNSGVKSENLVNYFNKVEKNNVELEQLKQSLTQKYKPQEIGNEFSYVFDFDNYAIIYTKES